ncbi:MAG: riboflavin biosynthesis protein RibF, partial [Candidatus Omnitrophica bacterium]|nr:riboflavin biosynthesis protein RibF [Candidatus Omnitrophota bacterium]
ARRLRGTGAVITFDPDPQTVLDPGSPHPTLMPLEARVERLRALGVTWIWVIPFTKPFARLTATQFAEQVLVRRLRAVGLVVGEGFLFGRNRRGNMEVLRAIGARHGLRIVAVPQVRRGGLPVSSSRIRRLIAEGRLAAARQLLGRSPELHGRVVRGAGRGRRLGFPTANLHLTSQVLPPCGVYAVRLHSIGAVRHFVPGELIGGGVMNLGVRPTFGSGPLVCEVHVLDFSGTLRGRPVAVSLLARLRGERCFPSPEALRAQIRRDVSRARRVFARSSSR